MFFNRLNRKSRFIASQLINFNKLLYLSGFLLFMLLSGNALADDISTSGWRLWPDTEAKWQDDTLYLPSEVDLTKLSVNPPTGGWEVLSDKQGIAVTLPSTVKEHYWGKFGLRPYQYEYVFESRDHQYKAGIAACAIPCGKGQIVIYSLPGLSSGLLGQAAGIHPVVAQRLVANALRGQQEKGRESTVSKRNISKLEQDFLSLPDSARPRTLWMWMGSNISKKGITRELEAMKEAGLGGTSMFSLSDTCTPWAGVIGNSPTPQVIAFSEPWWQLVRHAAAESKRLGLEFGMHNCPGYESSGGPWITPELSMQQIVWSQKEIKGPVEFNDKLNQPSPDLRAEQPFPVFNPKTGLVEKPEIPARREYYKDIAVLALPAQGTVIKDNVIDLTAQMTAEGILNWKVPEGDWIIYRFGHTTMGTLIQPSQWEATGLECDKMSSQAVEFHMNHVLGQIKQHLGNLVGTGFTHIHFDSYEAGVPDWTPEMPEEFKTRRRYALIPYLPAFAGRIIDSEDQTNRFRGDFHQTIRDLYRDVYYPTISRLTHEAGLQLSVEPYGGPWSIPEVMAQVDRVMTEFWTWGGRFGPYELSPTVDAAWAAGRRIIEAEAFTGGPGDSQWAEYPAWLKPIGDAAFCAGVNRICFHRWAHDPWDDNIRPGMTMGQWGSHIGNKQTWWEPGKAWLDYLRRCQALLQRGEPVRWNENDFKAQVTDGNPQIQYIHRRDGDADIYFVANIENREGTTSCSFAVSGKQPELWDPVWATMRDLPEYENKDGKTIVPLEFAPCQSFFIVFRRQIAPYNGPVGKNFPILNKVAEIGGPWTVSFDPNWGGPENAIFEKLEDWTERSEPGIKYYSGTAVYRTTFDAPSTGRCFIDLGQVNHLARVRLNGRNLGVIWTAPWRAEITGTLKDKNNELEIEVTNLWVNRLIGDEQEPPDCEWLPGHQGFGGFLKALPEWFVKGRPRPSKGRYCFTTWNYFNKNSPLVPSGLLGPVTLHRQ